MAVPTRPGGDTTLDGASDPPSLDEEFRRWGGIAGLAGVASMVAAVAVVVAFGLPDASDPETLRDFDDLEAGRIAEHLFYLGALVLFMLHLLVLGRLLRANHLAAAVFGAAVSVTGLGIMAASAVLHVSTAPLADLYGEPGTTAAEQQAIEYAWHGSQSVFDTMLATGVLLVPIGIVLLGLAMARAPEFAGRIARASIGLGAIGVVGAVVSVVDTTSDASAVGVLAIVVFHLVTGWRTLRPLPDGALVAEN